MKQKRIALILVVIMLALVCFSACGNGVCTSHIDENGDNVCDICHKNLYIPPCTNHIDLDHDLQCDACGEYVKCSHIDLNEDRICDYCSADLGELPQEDINVEIYSINDLHGKFLDDDTQPGVDNLTTYLKEQRESTDNFILLSAGDMWQGTAESSLTRGELMTDWMNELDFDAMAIGNHEFDWGSSYIESNAALAEFPFLAINIYDVETNERVEYCDASIVIECDGMQVGVIGAIGDCYSSISSYMAQDVYFKTGNDLTNLVKQESNRLRYEGVDFIIYLIHDSYKSEGSYDMELSRGDYVDLVFEGHSHSRYVYKDSYNVYHLQAGAENEAISHVSLTFETDGDITLSADSVQNYKYDDYKEDPIVDNLMQKYEDVVGDPYRVIGVNDQTRDDAVVEQIVAMLYYNFGIEQWGDEYDIALGGGFLKTRKPYDLPAGDIDYAVVFSLFPFDNEVSLCSIKGKDLRTRFIENNSSDYYIFYDARSESYVENLDDNATYYIIVDSYTSQYAPNKLTVIATTTVYARDLLADYIASGALTRYGK